MRILADRECMDHISAVFGPYLQVVRTPDSV